MFNLNCNTCDGIFDTVDIRFTKKCNNNCSFCIEKFSSIPAQPTDVDAIVASVLSIGATEVLILGGEPFLEIDKLLEIVKIFKENNITIYITTSLPKIILDNIEKFDEIVSIIDGLNVSVHHIKSRMNNKVYRNNSHNRIKLLAKIVEKFPTKTRVCVNIVKGYIDTRSAILNTLNTLYSMGVKSVKLNELSHSEDYVSFEKVTGIKLGRPYATGCYTRVYEHLFEGMHVELKRSCFVTEKTLNAGIADFCKAFTRKFINKPKKSKFCVVYEDGTIYNNWVTK